jgi:hypothetical protein
MFDMRRREFITLVGGVATCGAGTASRADAAHRRAPQPGFGRPGITKASDAVYSRPAAIGLRRRRNVKDHNWAVRLGRAWTRVTGSGFHWPVSATLNRPLLPPRSRSKSRDASEIVMLTCRMLHFSCRSLSTASDGSFDTSAFRSTANWSAWTSTRTTWSRIRSLSSLPVESPRCPRTADATRASTSVAGTRWTDPARSDPSLAKVGHQTVEAAKLQITPEDVPDPLGLLLDHDDLAVLGRISEWGNAVDPD